VGLVISAQVWHQPQRESLIWRNWVQTGGINQDFLYLLIFDDEFTAFANYYLIKIKLARRFISMESS
jgi:hypothetical protein